MSKKQYTDTDTRHLMTTHMVFLCGLVLIVVNFVGCRGFLAGVHGRHPDLLHQLYVLLTQLGKQAETQA